MDRIAIIGTAGRDKTKPMTLALWGWMCKDALERIPKGAHLVSGGAAWADHLAVNLFLNGHASALTLHLPAPLDDSACFVGPHSSAASAANYYHDRFSNVIGLDTRWELLQATQMAQCHGGEEPAAPGYGAMFARNRKVAADATHMLAYTFADGDVPADGGTKHTWDMFTGTKTHISLPILR